MSNLENKPTEPFADPNATELAGIIEMLGPIPDRDPLAAERSKARFLSELEALSLPESNLPFTSRLPGLLRLFSGGKKKEENKMNTPTQRFAFSTVALIAIVALFLFGGTGSTVWAAQNALPGDALYPVKTSFERTQVSLSADAADRAELYLKFADRRMEEITKLIAEGRFNTVSTATDEYGAYMIKAASELELIARSDPAKSADLARRIAEELNAYAKALAGMQSQVPDSVKMEMEHAIQAAGGGSATDNRKEIELTGVVETVGNTTITVEGKTFAITAQTELKNSVKVGDTVKIHGLLNSDGSLTAREVELASQDNQGQQPVVDDKSSDSTELNDDHGTNGTEIEDHEDSVDNSGSSGSEIDDHEGNSSGTTVSDDGSSTPVISGEDSHSGNGSSTPVISGEDSHSGSSGEDDHRDDGGSHDGGGDD